MICDLLVQHTALHPCAGWPDSSLSQYTMAHPETGEELKQGWALEEREFYKELCEEDSNSKTTLTALSQPYVDTYLGLSSFYF